MRIAASLARSSGGTSPALGSALLTVCGMVLASGGGLVAVLLAGGCERPTAIRLTIVRGSAPEEELRGARILVIPQDREPEGDGGVGLDRRETFGETTDATLPMTIVIKPFGGDPKRMVGIQVWALGCERAVRFATEVGFEVGTVVEVRAALDCCAVGEDCPNGLSAVERSWRRTAQDAPDAVMGAKLSYAPDRRESLMYGGVDSDGEVQEQLTSFDGSDWIKDCDPCPPGALVGHGQAIDTRRNRLVIFGGSSDGGPGGVVDAFWSWDGSTWLPIEGDGPRPSARWATQMVYDPIRDKVVLFGGQDAAGSLLGDIHEFDGTGWRAITTTGPAPAPRRDFGSTATFVGCRAELPELAGKFAIYGGESAGGPSLDDLWAWDGSAWLQICEACTGAGRSGAAVAYDAGTGRLVIQGGYGDRTEFAETWEVGRRTMRTATEPSARDSAAIVYDGSRDVIVLFGGNGGVCSGPGVDPWTANCNDVYEYDWTH